MNKTKLLIKSVVFLFLELDIWLDIYFLIENLFVSSIIFGVGSVAKIISLWGNDDGDWLKVKIGLAEIFLKLWETFSHSSDFISWSF